MTGAMKQSEKKNEPCPKKSPQSRAWKESRISAILGDPSYSATPFNDEQVAVSSLSTCHYCGHSRGHGNSGIKPMRVRALVLGDQIYRNRNYLIGLVLQLQYPAETICTCRIYSIRGLKLIFRLPSYTSYLQLLSSIPKLLPIPNIKTACILYSTSIHIMHMDAS